MKPNTLIFVDFPSDDVEACAAFYRDVFGFPLDDGSDSPVGNLHVGPVDQGRPRPRHPSRSHARMRHTSE